MRADIIFQAIGNTKSEYIVETAPQYLKPKRPVWIKWGFFAACICLVAVMIPIIINNSTQSGMPDPIVVGKALAPHQIPIEWYEANNSVDIWVRNKGQDLDHSTLDNRQHIVQLSDTLSLYNWTINVEAQDFSDENWRIDLSNGHDTYLSFWSNSNYVRWTDGKETKWFLADAQDDEKTPEFVATALLDYLDKTNIVP